MGDLSQPLCQPFGEAGFYFFNSYLVPITRFRSALTNFRPLKYFSNIKIPEKIFFVSEKMTFSSVWIINALIPLLTDANLFVWFDRSVDALVKSNYCPVTETVFALKSIFLVFKWSWSWSSSWDKYLLFSVSKFDSSFVQEVVLSPIH